MIATLGFGIEPSVLDWRKVQMTRMIALAALAIVLGVQGTAHAQSSARWNVVDVDHLGGGQAAIACPVDGVHNVMCFAVICPPDKVLHVAYLGNGAGVVGDRYNLRFTIDGKAFGDIRFDRDTSNPELDYFRAVLPPSTRDELIGHWMEGNAATFLFVDPRFSPGKLSLSGSKKAIGKVVAGCIR